MKKLVLTIFTVFTTALLFAQETNGLLFDGTDDYVVLNGTENYDIDTGDFTFEIACKADPNQPSFPMFFTNRPVVGQGIMFGLLGAWDGSGRLFVQLGGLNYGINVGGMNLMDGICHHVALTRSPDSLRFYIDGVKIYSRGTISATINTNQPFLIGKDEPTTTTHFNGVLKEARIWNIARSDQEIADFASTQLLGNETGLRGYWRFDEGMGQSVADITSAGNDGTLGSSSSQDTSDPTWTTDCDINYNTTSIDEPTNAVDKVLVKIVDFLGRETTFKPNTPLIKIYSDGSSERVLQLDY